MRKCALLSANAEDETVHVKVEYDLPVLSVKGLVHRFLRYTYPRSVLHYPVT